MAIPTPIIRNLEQDGILRTMAIDLSENPEDRAAIIEVLRSKLYSDKILAPIREYATNAMDSHVEAGCPDTPIKVVLPTQLEPEFHIRDYGIGLTPDEVEKIYIKYGRSTKRGTNAQTGQLGLGCKSAFAYGDNFVVISFKDGVKTTYNLTINGVCTIICAEPMTEDEKNGIEVIVPVNQTDIREFQNKAIEFFKYWKICPEMSGGDVIRLEQLRTELANKPLFAEEGWEIRPTSGYNYYAEKGTVVMGNVPYPIDWALISNKINLRSNDRDSVLYDFICRNKTILRVGIGELDFSASRESLEYTEKTCGVVVAKVRTILDSIFKILDSKIQTAKSYWEALLIYNQIFGHGDEKLFAGEVHRLEAYYKGKFAWKGIKIDTGDIEHLERWDQVLGYSDNGKWKDATGMLTQGYNPVLTTFQTFRNRIKQDRPNEYSNNRIPASLNTFILIHDLEKPALTKASVRWIFNEMPVAAGKNRPNKVYLLRFKDDAQKKDFFKRNHFDTVPVTYVSSIIDKVKTWMKQCRANNSVPSNGEPQAIRCFTPAPRLTKYGYWENISFDRDEVDMHETEGHYVEMRDGNAVINNSEVTNLAALSHHTNILLEAIGEKIETVYAFPERTFKAKWFQKAIADDQWTKLEDFLKEKEDLIFQNKAELLAKSIAYLKCVDDRSFLGIGFATRILPHLTHKDGAMYQACMEVTADLEKMSELANALTFFGIKLKSKDTTVDFSKLFKNAKDTYPLIQMLDNNSYIRSNNVDSRSMLSNAWIKNVADYVNLIDANSNKTKTTT